jgi:tetratricopeptide (TPR) repeat protein
MHISSRKFGFAGVCLFVLMLALPASAQNRVFKGKVVDDKGQPVVGAIITIEDTQAKSRTYTTKTDKKGTWIYMGLPDGFYYVAARAKGFMPAYKSQVRATIQQETEVNLTLQPGQDAKLPFEMTPEEQKKLEEDQKKMEARKQSSADVQAAFESGNKLTEEGNFEGAVEQYKKALEKDPEQANIWGNMAEAYRKWGKLQESLDTYKKAIEVNPNEPVFYTNMGVVLDKMGKSAESQEAFKKAATMNPGGSAQSYYNLGATNVNSGRTAEAIEAFRQAIAADANFAEAYYQLGMCLSGKPETWEEAIKDLETYVKIGQKPDQVDVAKAIIATLQQSLKKK